MLNNRLEERHVPALMELSKADGFPYQLTEEDAKRYCNGFLDLKRQAVQTYGAFHNGDKLVSVMTATFSYEFPHEDRPSGKVVQISGAFTLPEYRHEQNSQILLKAIEQDAELFGADYICCDSSLAGLCMYVKAGFKPSSETRMWKVI